MSTQRYPYSVSLQYGNEHFCGGALVAPDVVVTAGHCNGSISLDISYDVVIGRLDLTQRTTGQSIRLSREIRHPDYDEDTVDNDFNLVFLRSGVTWEGIEYIRLNDDATVPSGPDAGDEKGDPLTVVGWGDVDSRDDVAEASDVLMETVVHAMDNGACERTEGMVDSQWGEILTNLMGGITENMLCARADDTDACQVRTERVFLSVVCSCGSVPRGKPTF